MTEAGFAETWAKNCDAVSLAWRYKSSRLHDVATPYGGKLNDAVERVTAAVLITPVTTDRTHPIELSEAMSKALTKASVVYAPLDNMRGHAAVFRPPNTPEYTFVVNELASSLPA